ncbi:derlin-3 isoform X1 [Chlorella sorokiniana]|uniref:Derlin-3 isoform X1 n=1 Tax=Chlorella sorokiniana TaxID=3076 RepID=A0A2P6TK36_CHLSO|nr:derlin-3 isoform X1 [Chlorella sorokiniana]|eukprot:PRW44398.1 derlin-3 isoform X1 [Chlorella sorokiniana]
MGSLLLDLVRQALPHVPLNKGVLQANTDSLLDALPLITMAPCLATLQLHWRRGRYADFVLFFAGFALALIYHWLHMHPEGIANAHFLGLPGSTWRGLDILMAQALLARTLGHAVGARSTPIHILSNLVFPAALLGYAHLLADGVLTLGFASKVLVLVLLATLAAKALLEGFHTLPRYCPRYGKRTLACFAAGFAVFPLPELFPSHYWFFHSLWHVFLAEAFHLLYLQLEGAHLLERQGSGSGDSASEFLASQLSSGSWASAAALLQPAQRLVRPRQRRAGQGQGQGSSRSESPSQSQGGCPRMSLRSGKKVW